MRFKVEKLIRDRVPTILCEKGITVHHRQMEKKEFLQRLKEKIQEEAEEVKLAEGTEDLLEELADVLEVIHATVAAVGSTIGDVEELRVRKREQRGGFDLRLYGVRFDMEENHPDISYFVRQPDKYPVER
jgi:predicted house-cleaning noncanonical NTP pyrophosphatase (MazG superfamily)